MFVNSQELGKGSWMAESWMELPRGRENSLRRVGKKERVGQLAVWLGGHDWETDRHCQRTAEMAARLAEKFDINPEMMRQAARIHDSGKLFIPRDIINKPGRLTDKEREIINKHPMWGWLLINNLGMQDYGLVCLYHHERWDGLGYPRGLRGEEIPLEARIMSVVDVWDAVTTNRSYRSAWPEEMAVDYICEQAGKQFDPEVADEFIRLRSLMSVAVPMMI